jgi:hypothetical protein
MQQYNHYRTQGHRPEADQDSRSWAGGRLAGSSAGPTAPKCSLLHPSIGSVDRTWTHEQALDREGRGISPLMRRVEESLATSAVLAVS